MTLPGLRIVAIFALVTLAGGCGAGQPGAGAGGPCNRIAACRAGCVSGAADACYRLAVLLDTAPQRATIERELPLLQRSCDAGQVRTCVGLADLVCERGESDDRPQSCEQREHDLLQRACDAGDGLGCFGQARLDADADSGADHSALTDKTLTLLRDGCDRGNPYDCVILAALGRRDRTGPALESRARVRLDAACRRDDGIACALLAAFLAAGPVPDPGAARSLLAKACRLSPELRQCGPQPLQKQ